MSEGHTNLANVYVQASWKGASSKQREKLLELIRRLAEDDKVIKRKLSQINLHYLFLFTNNGCNHAMRYSYTVTDTVLHNIFVWYD